MSERWKPEDGEIYWCFDCDGRVFPLTYHGDCSNFKLMAFGNMFKTEKEAQSAVKKVKALLLSLQEPFTDCKQLPKLTAEVFDREDCPEWAKYAAVDYKGYARWYKDVPTRTFEGGWFCYDTPQYIPGIWDACDWQNSLIERPSKLPDWCKVGEWVWLDPQKIMGSAGYKKIKNIEGFGLTFSDGCCVYFSQKIKQARLRAYNAEEMKALVGGIIETQKDIAMVLGYSGERNKICVATKDNYFSAETLLAVGATSDGKPCGVLEHLNDNGEWVE